MFLRGALPVVIVATCLLSLPPARAVGGGGSNGPGSNHIVTNTKAEGGNILKNDKLLQDTEHLHEDMKGELSREELDAMTPNELEFHYFKLHDFDKNFKLDGLEMLAALSHVVQHGDEDERLDLKNLHLVEDMIDDVLRDGDHNKDGFLSYVEYKQGRAQASNTQ